MAMIYDYTPLLRLSDGKYPVFYPQVRKENPSVMFPYPYNELFMVDWGYKVVNEVELPSGDVITEGVPELREDGNYYKTYTSRPFNEQEVAQNLINAKNTLIYQADSLFDFELLRSFTFNKGDINKPVHVSGRNMLLWENMVNTMTAEGLDSAIIRFQDDTFLTMSLQEVKEFYAQMSLKLFNMRKNCWAFIESVQAVEDINDLPVTPETFMED